MQQNKDPESVLILDRNLKFNTDKILGQTKTMHCGDTATIIGYRKFNDIDIQFDDGTIVRHCSLSAFKGCRIQHPKYKIVLNNDEAVGRHIIGESNMMSCGLEATIIAYRSSRDIDIQFSDGAIAANKNYGNFRKGKIDHPYTKPSASYAERVIAGFLKAAKIDFQSEWSDATLRGENQKKPLYFDFAIFDNTRNVVLLIEYQGMQHFKEIEMFGGAKSYKRLKMHDQRKKDYAQINHIPLLEIPYSISSLEDIVSFLNGELRNYSAISSFVSPPIRVDSIDISDLNSTRIGETNLMKCGMHATITAYRSSSDIDVQFEDGTILCGVSYRRFVLKDLITKETSNKAKIAKKRIGETNVMKNGMTATIIRYGNTFDIDIQFCDGTIRKNQSYSNFTNGNIGNPNFKK